MKKQKTNKVKTVVYLIHFILIDIWARNGVLHIFSPPPKGLIYQAKRHRTHPNTYFALKQRKLQLEKSSFREYEADILSTFSFVFPDDTSWESWLTSQEYVPRMLSEKYCIMFSKGWSIHLTS